MTQQLPPPTGWRARINSHDRYSHDTIASLGHDWSYVADPQAKPQFPYAVYWPESTEEVARTIREAAELGERLLIRGNAHSSNGLSNGERARVVITTRLTGLVELDTDAGLATVKAGTLTADLDEYLRRQGFGLPVMGSHNHITVGGFASVGGVGMTCHRFGLFVDNVERVQYVDWTGDVRIVTRTDDPHELNRLLCGTGRHGLITELTLRVCRIDKDGTLLELRQESYDDFSSWLSAVDPVMHDPGDAVMLRALWTDFLLPAGGRRRSGTINRYTETSPRVAKWARQKLAWGLLHGVGYLSGRVPKPLDLALREIAIAGSIRPPRYSRYRYVEHLLDQVIDFTAGDPSRWLISWAPVATWRQLAREQTEFLVDLRAREGCLSFISLDIRPMRSSYLADGGDDRFVEILHFVGIRPARLTADRQRHLIRRLDELCVSHSAYRYMHTLTSTDEELRRQVDPNTLWADPVGLQPAASGEGIT